MRSHTKPEPNNNSAPARGSISRGVARLLHGPRQLETADSHEPEPSDLEAPSPSSQTVALKGLERSGDVRVPALGANEVVAWRRLVQGSLIGTDAFLAGIAAYLAFSNKHPFGFIEAMVCLLAILAGCWLTCLALWLEP